MQSIVHSMEGGYMGPIKPILITVCFSLFSFILPLAVIAQEITPKPAGSQNEKESHLKGLIENELSSIKELENTFPWLHDVNLAEDLTFFQRINNFLVLTDEAAKALLKPSSFRSEGYVLHHYLIPPDNMRISPDRENLIIVGKDRPDPDGPEIGSTLAFQEVLNTRSAAAFVKRGGLIIPLGGAYSNNGTINPPGDMTAPASFNAASFKDLFEMALNQDSEFRDFAQSNDPMYLEMRNFINYLLNPTKDKSKPNVHLILNHKFKYNPALDQVFPSSDFKQYLYEKTLQGEEIIDSNPNHQSKRKISSIEHISMAWLRALYLEWFYKYIHPKISEFRKDAILAINHQRRDREWINRAYFDHKDRFKALSEELDHLKKPSDSRRICPI